MNGSGTGQLKKDATVSLVVWITMEKGRVTPRDQWIAVVIRSNNIGIILGEEDYFGYCPFLFYFITPIE